MMDQTIHVVARVTALPHYVEEVKALLLELIEPTRQEAGCLHYQVLQSKAVPTEFVLVEVWSSAAAVDAHLNSPHVQEAFIEGSPLLASPPEIHRYHDVG